MKIFTWMRNANQGSHASNTLPKSCKLLQQSRSSSQIYADHHQSCKEEFSDWPNGLLAIGTFGNSNLKHSERVGDGGEGADSSSPREMEEVGKELKLLLNSKHMTVDQLLECLHLEKKSSLALAHKGMKDSSSSSCSRSRGVSNKSMSFLIKKALLCGAPPPPKFRDPHPDLSRVDKIMRAMLHKKIYPKRPTHKKYLDMPEAEREEEEEANHRSKWVKTDSEYIVLEI